MTDYVLEILDGDQAGTIVELRGSKLRIGRRPDNDLVMRDEKCSGHHAEVVVEDGRHVLRDLGSTNGTMIDDRRITEIALTAGDVFQLGRVRVAFRVAGEAVVPIDGDPVLAVGTVDVGRLQRSRRRKGSLLFGALVLAAVVGGGAFFFLSRTGGGGAVVGSKTTPPLRIEGNKIAAGVGDFEGDSGWDTKVAVDALGFEIAVDRLRAHSGTGALSATWSKLDSGARFALARLHDPIVASVHETLHVTAHARTSGRGRVGVRALFSTASGDLPEMRTGSAPAASAEWQEIGFTCRVPRGADRVAVEVLALLEGDNDEVLVDDVAVRTEGEAPEIQASVGGVSAIGAGASARIDAAKAPILLGVEPLLQDGPLADLARRGLLAMSDLGAELSVGADEHGFTFEYRGGTVDGLRLLLPAESATPRVRAGKGPFQLGDTNFDVEGVTSILVGGSDNRALFGFDSPVHALGRPHTGAWSIEIPQARRFAVQVVFGPEVLQANALLRDARGAWQAGKPGEALDKLDGLIGGVPHDVEILRNAQTLRSELLAAQERRLDDLLRDGDDARFFESQAGYRRVLDGLAALQRDFAPGGLVRAAAATALAERMREGLAAVLARAAHDKRELLDAMSQAFEQAGDASLAKLVRDFQERTAPKTEGDK